jgi:hypothetical protein
MQRIASIGVAGRFCALCLLPTADRSRHPFSHVRIYAGYRGPASANWRICPTPFESTGRGRAPRATAPAVTALANSTFVPALDGNCVSVFVPRQDRETATHPARDVSSNGVPIQEGQRHGRPQVTPRNRTRLPLRRSATAAAVLRGTGRRCGAGWRSWPARRPGRCSWSTT